MLFGVAPFYFNARTTAAIDVFHSGNLQSNSRASFAQSN